MRSSWRLQDWISIPNMFTLQKPISLLHKLLFQFVPEASNYPLGIFWIPIAQTAQLLQIGKQFIGYLSPNKPHTFVQQPPNLLTLCHQLLQSLTACLVWNGQSRAGGNSACGLQVRPAFWASNKSDVTSALISSPRATWSLCQISLVDYFTSNSTQVGTRTGQRLKLRVSGRCTQVNTESRACLCQKRVVLRGEREDMEPESTWRSGDRIGCRTAKMVVPGAKTVQAGPPVGSMCAVHHRYHLVQPGMTRDARKLSNSHFRALVFYQVNTRRI